MVAVGLWTLVAVTLFRFFTAAKFLLLGGLMTAAVAAVLRPLTDRLPGPTSLRAVVSVVVMLAVLVAAVAALSWALYGPVERTIERLPEMRRSLNESLRRLSTSLRLENDLTLDELVEIGGNLLTGSSATDAVRNVAGGVLTTVIAILVVLIGALYLLTGHEGDLTARAVGVLPAHRRAPTLRAVRELQPQLRGWMLGTLFSMTTIGLITAAGYSLIGLDFALPLALVAALTQSVPVLGPLVTLVLSLLVALPQGGGQVVGVSIVYAIVQTVESYLLTPMVMRRAVHIPPVVTLFTLFLWGNIFGLIGLVLAVPLDLVVWTMLKKHIIEFPDAPAYK